VQGYSLNVLIGSKVEQKIRSSGATFDERSPRMSRKHRLRGGDGVADGHPGDGAGDGKTAGRAEQGRHASGAALMHERHHEGEQGKSCRRSRSSSRARGVATRLPENDGKQEKKDMLMMRFRRSRQQGVRRRKKQRRVTRRRFELPRPEKVPTSWLFGSKASTGPQRDLPQQGRRGGPWGHRSRQGRVRGEVEQLLKSCEGFHEDGGCRPPFARVLARHALRIQWN